MLKLKDIVQQASGTTDAATTASIDEDECIFYFDKIKVNEFAINGKNILQGKRRSIELKNISVDDILGELKSFIIIDENNPIYNDIVKVTDLWSLDINFDESFGHFEYCTIQTPINIDQQDPQFNTLYPLINNAEMINSTTFRLTSKKLDINDILLIDNSNICNIRNVEYKDNKYIYYIDVPVIDNGSIHNIDPLRKKDGIFINDRVHGLQNGLHNLIYNKTVKNDKEKKSSTIYFKKDEEVIYKMSNQDDESRFFVGDLIVHAEDLNSKRCCKFQIFGLIDNEWKLLTENQEILIEPKVFEMNFEVKQLKIRFLSEEEDWARINIKSWDLKVKSSISTIRKIQQEAYINGHKLNAKSINTINSDDENNEKTYLNFKTIPIVSNTENISLNIKTKNIETYNILCWKKQEILY